MKKILANIIMILAISALAGCASLIVDVDVYKGPLVNHDDVQLEQTIVLAEMAKPLLEEIESHIAIKVAEKEKASCKEDDTAADHNHCGANLSHKQHVYATYQNIIKSALDLYKAEFYLDSKIRNPGLNVLIESYRKSLAEEQTNDSCHRNPRCGLNVDRENLLNTLTTLAEKIVLLTDQAMILKTNQSHGIVLDTLGMTVKALFDGMDTGIKSIGALQAVGYSILYQVDEIKQKNRHASKQRADADREMRAVHNIGLPENAPKSAIDNFIETLKFEGDALSKMPNDKNDAETALTSAKNAVNNKTNGSVAQAQKAKTSLEELQSAKSKYDSTVAASKFFTEQKGEITKALEEETKPLEEKKIIKQLQIIIGKQLTVGQNVTVNGIIDIIMANIPKDDDLKTQKGEQVYKIVSDKLANAVGLDKKTLETAERNLDIAKQTDAVAQKELKTAQEQLEAAVIRLDRAEKNAESIKRGKDLSAIHTQLESKQADLNGVYGYLGFAHDSLKITISTMVGKTNIDKAKQSEYTAEMKERVKNMIYPAQLFPTNAPPKPTDVMDQLISVMKQKHLLALQNGDKNKAASLAEAIAKAYDYRSGMIRIRPAMAFLRSSNPAAAFQRDVDADWDNKLTSNSVRNVPIIGGVLNSVNKTTSYLLGRFFDRENEADKNAVGREMDKRYWQNVNTVRLAGGGNTNYVVAKDDIGNWSVKQFSADPKDIFDTAKNGALFGLSGKMGTNLLRKQAEKYKMPDGAESTEPKYETGMERQFKKYQENYDKQSKDYFKQIEDKPGSLKTEIEEKWKADSIDIFEKLKEASENAWNSHLKNIKDGEDENTLSSEKIVKRLRGVMRYYNDLNESIRNMKSSDVANKDKYEAGRKSMSAIVKGFLQKSIENRKKTVGEYETAVIFTGQTLENK